MLPTSPWELYCNSRSTRSGAQFPIFHESWVWQRGCIAQGIVGHLPCYPPFPPLCGRSPVPCAYRPQTSHFCPSSQTRNLSPRRDRHLEFIAQFRYIRETANTAADAFSHLDAGSLHTTSTIIDFKAMAAAQSTDPQLDGAPPSLTLS